MSIVLGYPPLNDNRLLFLRYSQQVIIQGKTSLSFSHSGDNEKQMLYTPNEENEAYKKRDKLYFDQENPCFFGMNSTQEYNSSNDRKNICDHSYKGSTVQIIKIVILPQPLDPFLVDCGDQDADTCE